MAMKTVGILTGGGDCPGLNAVIRGAVRKGMSAYGFRFRGVQQGWRGMMEGVWEPLGSLWGLVCKSGEALECFGEPRIGISSRISIPSELKSEILEEILILRWLWGPLGRQEF